MRHINLQLKAHYPCPTALCLGYFCSPCTLGFSFCLPNYCIKDTEEILRKEIKGANKNILHEKGLEMSYQKSCGTSWLEIDLNYGKPINNSNSKSKSK